MFPGRFPDVTIRPTTCGPLPSPAPCYHRHVARTRSPLPVFLLAAGGYLWFALPAAGWQDGAELGAAAATLGIPHPTGFPLDMLYLQWASWMPLGALGFRQNVFTALMASGALAWLARSVEEALLLARRPPLLAAFGGLLAAALLAGWKTLLEASLAVEVYASSLFLSGLALHPAVRNRPGRLGLIGGLSSGAHLSARWVPLLLALRSLATCRERSRRLTALLLGGGLGTLILLYLPVASSREPALDWGDPQTWSRFWEHLSAARIRSAFAGHMLSADAMDALRSLGTQLGELGIALPLALWGLSTTLRSSSEPLRQAARFAVLLLAVDLLYGVLLNPMGVADRQVGFLAGASLAALGAMGGVHLLHHLLERSLLSPSATRPLLGMLSLGLLLWNAWRIETERWHDGYAAEELLGAGGPLLRLPPRSVLLCEEDDLCAQLWFARYAVGARPDVTAVPVQHLWEPRVRAMLPVSLRPEDAPAESLRPLAPRARLALVGRVLRTWRDLPVPLFAQLDAPPPTLRPMLPADEPPWRTTRREAASLPSDAFAKLLNRYRAREGERLVDPPARGAWSRAFEQVGRGTLDIPDPHGALRFMEAAARIAPWRAAAWVNLGVVRARLGDLDGAIQACTEALRRDPRRATAWANLVTYLRAQGRTAAARAALDAAAAQGVHDPRLARYARELGLP